ncbi:unnamed protein product [Calicophoron daubneyi]|uniref:Globin domain-containing protein n=1 Tax=Calicophoron daubneyi TaxID=300641 RepID=A0AAV2TLX5_CALDB
MGSEHSRMSGKKRISVGKRWSLPMHLISVHKTHLHGSYEVNNATPGSSYSGQEIVPEVKIDEPGSFVNKRPDFTEFEQDVLLSTWPLIASDMLGNGCLVFQNAFNIFPHLTKFFQYSLFSPSVIVEHEQPKRLVLSFMDVIAKAIDSLTTNRELFYQEMMLLGAKHAAIPGMKLEYFKVFKQSILMTWEGLMYEEFTEDVRKAWAHLIDYIIGILTEGCLVFEEEEDKMLMATGLPHRASDTQLEHMQLSTRRRSGRPSVVSMTPEELSHFYSICK